MGISEKQKKVLQFPYSKYTALIADGSVRAGKTVFMSLSFVLWAMGRFNNCNFAICGKSVGSAERNVIKPLQTITYLQKHFILRYSASNHILTISRGNKTNWFYVFGGKDESSYMLIQGITLAGVMFDEVALQPQSFVNQAIARCSVDGRKLFFNCNPENPLHWFRKEWLLDLDGKNAMHLHFTMDDNPGLSDEIKEGYKRMYSGVFYKRYIEGLWVMAEGVIYDMINAEENVYRPDDRPVDLYWTGDRMIAIDYGTTNPTRFLDTYEYDGCIYIDREYDWDSRERFRQKTDEEYAQDLLEFMGEHPCACVVDPSAASFIAALEQKGVYVLKADNEVLDGIRRTGSLMQSRRLKICSTCIKLLDEVGTYSWDEKAAQRGEEKPIKQNDHSCDAMRYRINMLPDWWFE